MTKEYISITSYFEIKDKLPDSVTALNLQGQLVEISNSLIDSSFRNSLTVEKEVKLSPTNLIKVLIYEVGDSVFSCKFKKAPDKNGVEEERVAIGYLYGNQEESRFRGRSKMMDLEKRFKGIPASHSQIQVDHRSLSEIIFNKTRYYCGK